MHTWQNGNENLVDRPYLPAFDRRLDRTAVAEQLTPGLPEAAVLRDHDAFEVGNDDLRSRMGGSRECKGAQRQTNHKPSANHASCLGVKSIQVVHTSTRGNDATIVSATLARSSRRRGALGKPFDLTFKKPAWPRGWISCADQPGFRVVTCQIAVSLS